MDTGKVVKDKQLVKTSISLVMVSGFMVLSNQGVIVEKFWMILKPSSYGLQILLF